MPVMLSWHGRSLEVSPRKIMPVEGFSRSFAIKSDTEDTSSRLTDPETMSFSATIVAGMGVDIRAEIDAWGALVGISDTLYIGGRQCGAWMMRLKSFSTSDVQLTPEGNFVSAACSFEFEENTEGGGYSTPPVQAYQKNSATATAGGRALAASVQQQAAAVTAKPVFNETVRRAALNAAPTEKEKSERKPAGKIKGAMLS